MRATKTNKVLAFDFEHLFVALKQRVLVFCIKLIVLIIELAANLGMKSKGRLF